MKRIGFLTAGGILSEEEESARAFLQRSRQYAWERLPLDAVSHDSLGRYDLLWWHYERALALPGTAAEPGTIAALKRYLTEGGSLLLSLLACQYVTALGIERTAPNLLERGSWNRSCWAKDYPDIRGFSSYRGHPLFAGLHGAAFTWNPAPDTPFAAAIYQAPSRPSDGRVVAIERQYIALNDSWRVITEYSPGRGRVLCIGTFLFFKDPGNRFRRHLELLTTNALAYLAAPAKDGRKSYWDFGPRTVQESKGRRSPRIKTSSAGKARASGLCIDRQEATDNAFDVGGRRILIMGTEHHGIEEVWVHPLRILRNLRVGIGTANTGTLWTDAMTPHITVRPESITRTYVFGGATMEESIAGDPLLPGGVVSYHLTAKAPVELMLSAEVDLRLMWPLSAGAAGALHYRWDEGLHAFIVCNDSGSLCALFGVSHAPSHRFAGPSHGLPEHAQAACVLRIPLPAGTSRIALGFAGSDQGEREAIRAYRRIMQSPAAVAQRQSRAVVRLLHDTTQIESSDPEFNEGYRWAVVAMDRFLAETPNIGCSYMAGYATTAHGWNGGQAVSGRPGYAWYFGRDSVWTSLAALACGHFANVRSVLKFLGQYQDVTGKIMHEMTTSGHVHYDAADATPLYVILLGRYLRATNDRQFVRHEFPRLVKAMEFCFSTDTDGDGLIENTNVGHGWVEGGALFPTHVELYLASCWAEALREAANVAGLFGKKELTRVWAEESEHVVQSIRRDFWNPGTGFYNFGKKTDGTFNAEQTVLPTVAMYFGHTEREKCGRALDAYASENFSTDWGVRIIGKDNRMFRPTGYHYGSIWPLFTGWVSLAAFACGRPAQGFTHLMSNLLLYRDWSAGNIPEVMEGLERRPSGVCQHQAWSESMVVQPVLEGLLGTRADAPRGLIIMRPYLPETWTWMKVRNLPCGTHRIDLAIQRKDGSLIYHITHRGTGTLTVHLQPQLPEGTTVTRLEIGATAVEESLVVANPRDFPIIKLEVEKRMRVKVKN